MQKRVLQYIILINRILTVSLLILNTRYIFQLIKHIVLIQKNISNLLMYSLNLFKKYQDKHVQRS